VVHAKGSPRRLRTVKTRATPYCRVGRERGSRQSVRIMAKATLLPEAASRSSNLMSQAIFKAPALSTWRALGVAVAGCYLLCRRGDSEDEK